LRTLQPRAGRQHQRIAATCEREARRICRPARPIAFFDDGQMRVTNPEALKAACGAHRRKRILQSIEHARDAPLQRLSCRRRRQDDVGWVARRPERKPRGARRLARHRNFAAVEFGPHH
jgi:hypothetical protein